MTGPFTASDAISFDDFQAGLAPISSVRVWIKRDTGVAGISLTYGNASTPVRGSSGGGAVASSLTLDVSAGEFISQAWLVPSSSSFNGLVLVTNKGRSVGGASDGVLRDKQNVISGSPCMDDSHRLAFIKGRAVTDTDNLEQLVLVWAPVTTSSSSSASQTASADRRLLAHMHRKTVSTRYVAAPLAADSLSVLDDAYGNRGRSLQHTENPDDDDDDAPPIPTPTCVRPTALKSTPLGILPAGVAPSCITRLSGLTATGPAISSAPAAPVRTYQHGALLLQSAMQQALPDPLPGINSVSIFSDGPDRVTAIEITYAGGYVVRHGATQPGVDGAKLVLGAGEQIVHVQVIAGWACPAVLQTSCLHPAMPAPHRLDAQSKPCHAFTRLLAPLPGAGHGLAEVPGPAHQHWQVYRGWVAGGSGSGCPSRTLQQPLHLHPELPGGLGWPARLGERRQSYTSSLRSQLCMLA